MNKAAIVARVARRMGLNKFAAEGAVDTVLEAIAESLAKEEDVRIAGFGTFRTRSRAARDRAATPGDGRERADTGLEDTVVQGGKIGLREAVKRGWQPEMSAELGGRRR